MTQQQAPATFHHIAPIEHHRVAAAAPFHSQDRSVLRVDIGALQAQRIRYRNDRGRAEWLAAESALELLEQGATAIRHCEGHLRAVDREQTVAAAVLPHDSPLSREPGQ